MVNDISRPASRKIAIDGYHLDVDIGFHAFEIGHPQRLRLDLEIWVDVASFPADDDFTGALNYDDLHRDIAGLVSDRRFNLQETVAHEVYALVAGRRGVVDLRVSTRKPDIYPDCEGVGVELASFRTR